MSDFDELKEEDAVGTEDIVDMHDADEDILVAESDEDVTVDDGALVNDDEEEEKETDDDMEEYLEETLWADR